MTRLLRFVANLYDKVGALHTFHLQSNLAGDLISLKHFPFNFDYLIKKCKILDLFSPPYLPLSLHHHFPIDNVIM